MPDSDPTAPSTVRLFGQNHLWKVLLVHGIDSRGEWQDAVAAVLRPHFSPEFIRYRQYATLGALKLLVEPWVLFLSLLLLLSLTFTLLSRFPLGTYFLILALTGLVLILLAHIASSIRRRSAQRSVSGQMGPFFAYGTPHIIAHSLGTYLTGTLLQRNPNARAKRVGFAGCALASDYNWRDVLARKKRVFEQLHNNWTHNDVVIWMAGLIRKNIIDFGDAGIRGFRSDRMLIHDVPHPTKHCGRCHLLMPAPIHNVDISDWHDEARTFKAHSDICLTPDFTARFWLPFLWGIQQPEYDSFIELCREAAELSRTGQDSKLAVVEDELLQTNWTWIGGTLRDSLEQRIGRSRLRGTRTVDELVGRSVATLYEIMERAARAGQDLLTAIRQIENQKLKRKDAARRYGVLPSTDLEWLICLDPRLAVNKAVDQVLRSR